MGKITDAMIGLMEQSAYLQDLLNDPDKVADYLKELKDSKHNSYPTQGETDIEQG